MKHLIVCLAIVACATVGAFAEEKKSDKKDCCASKAAKTESSCCAEKSGASCSGKSACTGEAPSKSKVLSSPRATK